MIYYSFAGLGIAFEFNSENIIESPCFGSFRLDAASFEKLSRRITVKVRSEVMPEREGLKLLYATDEARGYFSEGTLLRFNDRYDGQKYTCCFVSRSADDKSLIISDEDKVKIYTSGELFRLCDISSILLENGIIMLHSSFVIYNGKALLFSAPSGVGKSTQAALWQKERGAKIINGDRSLLRSENGAWSAYGVPYCGSSGICFNEFAPLAAIVMLSQGKTDEVVNYRAVEKITRLMPEISAQSGSPADMNSALDLALQLVAQAKVIGYSCTMNASAVDTLESEVFGNG